MFTHEQMQKYLNILTNIINDDSLNENVINYKYINLSKHVKVGNKNLGTHLKLINDEDFSKLKISLSNNKLDFESKNQHIDKIQNAWSILQELTNCFFIKAGIDSNIVIELATHITKSFSAVYPSKSVDETYKLLIEYPLLIVLVLLELI